MESLTLTEEHCVSLTKILEIFRDSKKLLIQQGNLKSDNVNLEWKKDIIRITIIESPAPVHSKEE